MVRASDPQLKEPKVEFCRCHFEGWAILFTPLCHSSLGCINEYLTVDMRMSGNCSEAECFPEKSS